MTNSQQMYEAYLQAELAILKGQVFEKDGRKLTRADLGEVVKQRQYWEKRVKAETAIASGKNSTVGFADFSNLT